MQRGDDMREGRLLKGDLSRSGVLKLQVGAGLDGPADWLNIDASPTLRLQRLPVVGRLLQGLVRPRFSPRVVYGDVVRGLPLAGGRIARAYSSHVLEHLAFEDLRAALAEVHRVLAPGGVFRSVLPDLEHEVQAYLASDTPDRASAFMQSTLLGVERRERGLVGVLRMWLGNSRHVWMWDYPSIAYRLAEAGFVDIRPAKHGDSIHPEFGAVEREDRWQGCMGFECRKAG